MRRAAGSFVAAMATAATVLALVSGVGTAAGVASRPAVGGASHVPPGTVTSLER